MCHWADMTVSLIRQSHLQHMQYYMLLCTTLILQWFRTRFTNASLRNNVLKEKKKKLFPYLNKGGKTCSRETLYKQYIDFKAVCFCLWLIRSPHRWASCLPVVWPGLAAWCEVWRLHSKQGWDHSDPELYWPPLPFPKKWHKLWFAVFKQNSSTSESNMQSHLGQPGYVLITVPCMCCVCRRCVMTADSRRISIH